MSATLARPDLISLAAGFTDSLSLPVADVRALTDEMLRSDKPGRAALQYGSTQGDPALLRLTVRHLQRADGAMWRRGDYSHDRAIITNGSQQLLYMTAEALCDTGDIVLVEDPTYFVYLDILQSRGLQARSIRLDRDGLNLAHLEEEIGRAHV